MSQPEGRMQIDTDIESLFATPPEQMDEIIQRIGLELSAITPEEALLLLAVSANHAYDEITDPAVALYAAKYLDGLTARIRLMHGPAQGNA